MSRVAVNRVLMVLAAGFALAGCVDRYGYRYAYDPYRGPYGYYVGPHTPKPPADRTPPKCHEVYEGPFQDPWRGPYYTGPYCAPAPAAAGVAPATPAATPAPSAQAPR